MWNVWICMGTKIYVCASMVACDGGDGNDIAWLMMRIMLLRATTTKREGSRLDVFTFHECWAGWYAWVAAKFVWMSGIYVMLGIKAGGYRGWWAAGWHGPQ